MAVALAALGEASRIHLHRRGVEHSPGAPSRVTPSRRR